MSVDVYLEFQSGDEEKSSWSVGEVDDFEQKLGLIDAKKSSEDDIQVFVDQFSEASQVQFCINMHDIANLILLLVFQCSRELHVLLLKMRRLGYINISEVMSDCICIKEGKEVFGQKVSTGSRLTLIIQAILLG